MEIRVIVLVVPESGKKFLVRRGKWKLMNSIDILLLSKSIIILIILIMQSLLYKFININNNKII